MPLTSWLSGIWRSHPLLADILIALVAATVVAATSIPAGDDQLDVRAMDALGFALVGLGAAGLVLRRIAPAVCVAMSLAATLTFLTLGYPYGPIFVYTALAMYAVAAWRSTRFALITAGLAILAHVPWSLLVETDGPLLTLAATTSWIAAPVGIGIAVRTRRQSRAESAVARRWRADYEQRLRIAQEVHDVVGHSLAVISVNAGAALHVLSKDPQPSPQLQRSLQAIRQASVGALDELRSTLANFTGMVEAPGRPSVEAVGPAGAAGDAGPARPVRTPRPATLPGLALLPRLAAVTEVAGLTVRYEEAGEPAGALPAAADVAAYRIVQEALANVVRHADARHAVVAVAYQPDGVLVTVIDDGRAVPLPHPSGTGLDSMRDRAASVGAAWTAGPRPGGGFEVRTYFSYEGERS